MSLADSTPGPTALRVAVLGAGAIGRYVALALAHGDASVEVTCLVRKSAVDLAARQSARSIHGTLYRPCDRVTYVARVEDLPAHDIVLVTVKSKDTTSTVADYLRCFSADTPLVMLQNGLHNPQRASDAGARRVLRALVAFNVVLREDTWWQATDGPIEIATGSDAAKQAEPFTKRLTQAWIRSGERALLRTDIDALARGKLLLNLNNGLCAIAGVTIAALVRDRDYRRCLALLIEEGLAVFRRAKLEVRSPSGMPPAWIPVVLRRSDAIFSLIARAQVRIDPTARSSTVQDLDARKSTEIDDLSGAICELAQRVGGAAPLNQWVCDRVHELEAAGQGPGSMRAPAMLAALEQIVPRRSRP